MENKKRELDKVHLIIIIMIFLFVILGIGAYMILNIPINQTESNETESDIKPHMSPLP